MFSCRYFKDKKLKKSILGERGLVCQVLFFKKFSFYKQKILFLKQKNNLGL
jgi:hypothetical protein